MGNTWFKGVHTSEGGEKGGINNYKLAKRPNCPRSDGQKAAGEGFEEVSSQKLRFNVQFSVLGILNKEQNKKTYVRWLISKLNISRSKIKL